MPTFSFSILFILPKTSKETGMYLSMNETASVCYGCEKKPLLTSFSEVKQHVHAAFLITQKTTIQKAR